MIKYLKNIIFFFLLIPGILFGQTGKTFWFAAPDISSGYGASGGCVGGNPRYIRVSTQLLEADITISQPANLGFIPVKFHLNARESQRIDLSDPGCGTPGYSSIENTPPNQVNNYGILIEATQYINAYYEIATSKNQDIWVLKGDNALGIDFWVPTQMIFDADWSYSPNPYNEIHIVATEDNTIVTITPAKAIVGHAAGVPFNVNMNKGQTYGLRNTSNLGSNHLSGTHITSTKDIAITISDDGITNLNPCNNFNLDINGDQIVPINNIGNEYIVMKSQINASEWVSILATVDGTEIRTGSNPVAITTINAGQTYSISITGNTYIKTTQDVYVYHLAGVGCEMGGALVPPIPCKGSSEVFFTRSSTQPLYLYLMVPLGSEDNFFLEYDDGTTVSIPFSKFEIVDGPTTPQYMAIKPSVNSVTTAYFDALFPLNKVVRIYNTERNFTMGILNAGEITGTNYGYFSSYSDIQLKAEFADSINTSIHTCFGDSIQLLATGGLTYYWSRLGGGGFDYLNNNNIPNPIATPPAGVQTYQVIVYGDCNIKDTFLLSLHMGWELEAQFHISDPVICAPDSIEISNTSIGYNIKYNWVYGDNSTDTTSNSLFYHTYLNNQPDSTFFPITLAVSDTFNCVDTLIRDVTVYAEVKSDFTLTPILLEGCHPFTIGIINNSSGDLGSYNWNFGDMSGSTLVQPGNHVYTNYTDTIADYILRLITTSPSLCKDTIQDTVKIFPYVTSDFVINETELCAPDTLIITNNSSGSIDTTIWDFGTGATVLTSRPDTASTIYVLYTNSTLSTINNVIKVKQLNLYGSCIDSFSRPLKVFPKITAGFIPSDTVGCSPLNVVFTDTSNNVAVTSDDYNWMFGDGGSSNTHSPNHLFINNGTTDTSYSVVLNTNSINNCKAYDTVTIAVHPFLNANFTIDKSEGCAIYTVNIDNQSSGDAETYLWDFGDGTPTSNSSASTLSHNFDNTTIVTTNLKLKLIVSNSEGCSDSLIRNINVFPKINTGILADVTSGCNHLKVNLSQDTTTTIIDTYIWDFGDGNSSYDSTILHEFTNFTNHDTNYTVIRKAVTPQGCEDLDTLQITIYAYLGANFSIDTAAGCTPLVVTHTLQGSGNITSQNWDFGSAGTSILTNPIFTYTNTNTNAQLVIDTIKLWVHNANCSDSITGLVTVYPVPSVDFTFSEPAVHCQPHEVTFTNISDSVSKEYLWEFGDTTSEIVISKTPDITHTYGNSTSSSIVFSPRLIGISDYYCSDTANYTITVEPYIKADFIILSGASSCSPATTFFQNISKGDFDEADWHFGDGITNLNQISNTVANIYPKNTTGNNVSYDAYMIARNTAGCTDTTVSKKVIVYPEVTANFSLDTNVGCHPFTPLFTNNSNTPTSPTKYYNWDFEYAEHSSQSENPVGIEFRDNYRYKDTTYTITLKVQSEFYCEDDTSMSITVHYLPYASLNITESSTCSPYTPIFSISNSLASANAEYYIKYGDNSDTTVNTPIVPNHTYQNLTTDTNQYVISVDITSENGCIHSDSTDITVYPEVVANFTVSDTSGCHPLEITFNSGTTVNGQYLSWDFDDGNISALANPQHEFYVNDSDEVSFDVSLTAVSTNNCSDDTSIKITVYQQPYADFSVQPRSRSVYPDTSFNLLNNTNTGTWQNDWSFDDNEAFQNIQNLSFTHSYPDWSGGEYNITLIVTNPSHAQCTDTTSQVVIVDPHIPILSFSIDSGQEAGCLEHTINLTDYSQYTYTSENIWDFGDGTIVKGGNAVSHAFNVAGTYFVKLTVTGPGGSTSDFKIVDVWPLPTPDFDYKPRSSEIKLMANDEISFINKTIVFPLDSFSYLWDFGDGSTSTDANPIHTFDAGNNSGYEVTLTVTTVKGCTNKDTSNKKLSIVITTEGVVMYPNAFTPNADGVNDYFLPLYEQVKEYTLEIYNRWGERVYLSSNNNSNGAIKDKWKGWNGNVYRNGKDTGKQAQQGVYIWKIKGKWENSLPFEYNGDVTLLR